MEQFDLKTTEGRINALKNLNGEYKKALKDLGVRLCQDSQVQLQNDSVEISIKDTEPSSNRFGYTAFSSEVLIHTNEISEFSTGPNTISVSSTSGFDPKVYKVGYWRAIHFSSLIENWDQVSYLSITYVKMYRSLCNQIREINK